MAGSAFDFGTYLGSSTPWVTGTAYTVGNVVTVSGTRYSCLINHTSGTFATDLAAGKWTLYSTPSSSTGGANMEQVWLFK